MTEERYQQVWNAGLEIKKILKKRNLHFEKVNIDGKECLFLCANEPHEVRYDMPVQNIETGETIQNATMTRKDNNE